MIRSDEGLWAFGLGVMAGLCLALILTAAAVTVDALAAAEEPQFVEPRCLTIIDHGRLSWARDRHAALRR